MVNTNQPSLIRQNATFSKKILSTWKSLRPPPSLRWTLMDICDPPPLLANPYHNNWQKQKSFLPYMCFDTVFYGMSDYNSSSAKNSHKQGTKWWMSTNQPSLISQNTTFSKEILSTWTSLRPPPSLMWTIMDIWETPSPSSCPRGYWMTPKSKDKPFSHPKNGNFGQNIFFRPQRVPPSMPAKSRKYGRVSCCFARL